MLRCLALSATLAAAPVWAETLVANRTLPARTVIAPGDLVANPAIVPGAATQISEVAGKETQAVIYAGQPIYLALLAAPALVERNQMIRLVFDQDGLRIMTEGRALERGAAGTLIRVMNQGSRTVVQGIVAEDGSVNVTGGRI